MAANSPSSAVGAGERLHYLPMDKGEAQPMYVCRKCGTHLALQVRTCVLTLLTFTGMQAIFVILT